VRYRLSPRLQRLAALVVAMALRGSTAAAPLHAKKGHAAKPPVQHSMPPMPYIHCAMGLREGPCGLDPAMQRLNREPPDSAHPEPRVDQPDFAPGR
jgi:hypothetical protein